ncbi:MAG: hypothetical protein D6698_14210 [Gammaproteobacteria bacterium]|nr:MAG: hypothetical protein D6698_14210 [Gammaproteobacteria bacterium]
MHVNSAIVRYGYGVKTIQKSTANVGYGYGSAVYTSLDKPQSGFLASCTQAITNNLPPWMEMRKSSSSVGWRLINAYGMSLDRVKALIDYNMRNLFPASADRKIRWQVYRTDIPSDEAFIPRGSKNILFNTAFTIPDVARTSLPAGWSNDLKPGASLSTLDWVSGGFSVSLDDTYISQALDTSTRGVIGDLTLSVYVREVDSGAKLSMSVSVQDMAGNISTYGLLEDSLSTKWERKSLTASVNKEVFTVQVVFRSIGGEILVDAPQLEIGGKATSWVESSTTFLPYLPNAGTLTMVEVRSFDKTVPLFPVPTEDIFADILIPTRIKSIPPPSKEIDPLSPKTSGEIVTELKERSSRLWRVVSGKVAETTSNSTIASYDIRDLRFKDLSDTVSYGTFNDTTVTITPLDCVVVGEHLLVLCKETYNSETLYTLKVCSPNRPVSGSYLESIRDLRVPIFENIMASGSTEEVSSIGVSESIPHILVVNTSKGRRLYYRLYYDYYFLRPGDRSLFTLESYDGSFVKVG